MALAAGVPRVLTPAGVLPQAAERLDPSPRIRDDEVRLDVERLNIDAAAYRQLAMANAGDGARIRAAVLAIVASRGKLQNPVTGSGGMLVGTVAEVGARSPLGLAVGERVASLVSLSLTPLAISDGLDRWDGLTDQVPCRGHAILFARSLAVRLPDDLPLPVALAIFDVCGAPALTARVIESSRAGYLARLDSIAVLGAAGKSGALTLAAARQAGLARRVGVVVDHGDARTLQATDLATEIVVADATNPVGLAEAVGRPVGLTVVCVDVSGAEHGAILLTEPGGTVIFFSMATSFTAAALGAEGLAADLSLLIGNGFTPGHSELALKLFRETPGVRQVFAERLGTGSV